MTVTGKRGEGRAEDIFQSVVLTENNIQNLQKYQRTELYIIHRI